MQPTRLLCPWNFPGNAGVGAISDSRGSPNPGVEPGSLASPTLAGESFTTVPPGKPISEKQFQILREDLNLPSLGQVLPLIYSKVVGRAWSFSSIQVAGTRPQSRGWRDGGEGAAVSWLHHDASLSLSFPTITLSTRHRQNKTLPAAWVPITALLLPRRVTWSRSPSLSFLI